MCTPLLPGTPDAAPYVGDGCDRQHEDGGDHENGPVFPHSSPDQVRSDNLGHGQALLFTGDSGDSVESDLDDNTTAFDNN